MKILNRKEFLAIKGEIVFAKYETQCCEDLAIKVENMGNDFICQHLSPDIAIEDPCGSVKFDKMENDSNVDYPVDLCCNSRDGRFDEDQLFLVLSKDDLISYIKRLELTLNRMID